MSTKPKVLRAPSPYILFCNAKRLEIKEKHPHASFGEVGKILGQMWTRLSDSDKKIYTDESERLKSLLPSRAVSSIRQFDQLNYKQIKKGKKIEFYVSRVTGDKSEKISSITISIKNVYKDYIEQFINDINSFNQYTYVLDFESTGKIEYDYSADMIKITKENMVWQFNDSIAPEVIREVLSDALTF